MATNFENTKRRTVPRWREFRTALQSGELDPLEITMVSKVPADAFILEKKREWEHNRTLLFATDFLGAAYVLGQDELATEAAEFVLDPSSGASSAARSVAERVLRFPLQVKDRIQAGGSQNESELYRQVKSLKEKRIGQPKNAFVWADLARLYTILGLAEQARRAMTIAYNLAPSNRYVLRSAVRLELHFGHPDKAHFLLRKTQETKYDPWLLATEIAVCSVLEKSSRLIKIGMHALENQSINPINTSELASALASVELWKGNAKKAKKLFRYSLRNPNDNALAQAVWATRYIFIENLRLIDIEPAVAFEAKALASYFDGQWKKSIEYTRAWLCDEPFSRRPYIHLSFLTSEILEDYKASLEILKIALTIIPNDPTLLNNLSFVQIHLGELTEAKQTLARIDMNDCPSSTKICTLATAGLLNYRLGKPEEGRRLYQEAILLAKRESMPLLRARAMIYLAREELLTRSFVSEEWRKQAMEETLKLQDPALELIAQRLAHMKLVQ